MSEFIACKNSMEMGEWMVGWMNGWMNVWMDGWMSGRAGLEIAYGNQKRGNVFKEWSYISFGDFD